MEDSLDLNRVVVEIDVYVACEKQSQDTRVQDLEEAKRRKDAKEKNKQKKIKVQIELKKLLKASFREPEEVLKKVRLK